MGRDPYASTQSRPYTESSPPVLATIRIIIYSSKMKIFDNIKKRLTKNKKALKQKAITAIKLVTARGLWK